MRPISATNFHLLLYCNFPCVSKDDCVSKGIQKVSHATYLAKLQSEANVIPMSQVQDVPDDMFVREI